MISIEEIEDEIRPLVNEHGLNIYDIEMGGGKTGMFFRLYVNSSEGVTIDSIHKLSKELIPFMNSNDLFPETGRVEVSSPGLYRKLRRQNHFTDAIGQNVSITIQNETGKRSIKAKLTGVTDTGIQTDNPEAEFIPFSDVKKSSLEPDI